MRIIVMQKDKLSIILEIKKLKIVLEIMKQKIESTNWET